MLEILIFVIAVVVVAILINKAVDLVSPNAGLSGIIHLVVGAIALILILKKVWPLLGHALS